MRTFLPLLAIALLTGCAGLEQVPLEADLSSPLPTAEALQILQKARKQSAVPVCRVSELGITSSAFDSSPRRFVELRAIPGSWTFSYAIRSAPDGSVVGQVAVTLKQEGYENLRGCYLYRRVIRTELPDSAISQMLPEVRQVLQALNSLGVTVEQQVTREVLPWTSPR